MKRSEAIARRLDRYMPDKPCKHGHMSEKYTKNAACIECSKANYEANRQPGTTKRCDSINTIKLREARENGWLTYDTGQPCINGHMSPRQTKNRTCIACLQQYRKNRYQRLKIEDPDHNNRIARAYREKHREHHLAYQREYHRWWTLLNPDKASASAKKKYAKKKAALEAYKAEIAELKKKCGD